VAFAAFFSGFLAFTGLTALARFGETRAAPRAAAFFATFLAVFFGAVLPVLREAAAVFLRPLARDDAEAPFAREAFATRDFAG
jgi:hypothetical protein